MRRPGVTNPFDLLQSAVCIVLTLASVPPDSERFEPGFCCCWLDVAECICKRGCSSFYLTKDTFDAIPISMATDMKSEPQSRQCRLEVIGVADEKRRIVGVVFLAGFTQKHVRQSRICGVKQPYVEEFVGFGIDGGVQPVALGPELNYSLVKRNVIRGPGSCWL